MTINSMNVHEEKHEGHEKGRVDVSNENVAEELASPSFNFAFSHSNIWFSLRKNFLLLSLHCSAST